MRFLSTSTCYLEDCIALLPIAIRFLMSRLHVVLPRLTDQQKVTRGLSSKQIYLCAFWTLFIFHVSIRYCM